MKVIKGVCCVLALLMNINGFAVSGQEPLTVEQYQFTETVHNIYVSPSGNDNNDGSIERPFRNFDRAKNAAENLSNSGTVTVYFREGGYPVSRTQKINIAAKNTIVYRSYPGEIARFEGGISVKGSDFKQITNKNILDRLPVAAIGRVVSLDLSQHGLSNYTVSFDSINPALVEVFYDNQVMQIARYPNKGMLHTGTPLDQGLGAHPGYEFKYEDDRLATWSGSKNAWIMGYFAWDWASLYARLDRVDLANKSIRLDRHDPYGILENKPWYIFNLIQELDNPGEYFIDSDTNILYFYPPEQPANSVSFQNAVIQIGLMEGYMFSLDNTENIIFKDITFENARGSGIEITPTCKNIQLLGCTIRNISSVGVWLGGYNNHIRSCDIYSLGGSAIYTEGGDRATLTPSNNMIVNNRIYDWGRILRENNAALRIKGCGDIISRNQVFNGPHLAISVGGNDCIVEYNDVYKVIMDGSTDAGLFYNAQDLSPHGNILRYNYFHDHPASYATVYLDDYTSGTTIYGNVIENVKQGMFIHDGMFNTYHDNVLINANKTGAVSGSPIRTWFTIDDSEVTLASSPVRYFLYLWPWNTGIWAEKYPYIKDILDPKNEYKAIGNKVYRNIAINVENGPEFELTGRSVEPGIVEMWDNVQAEEYTAEAIKAVIPDFEMLDMSKVGIYKDDIRVQLPRVGEFGLVFPADKSVNIEGREVEFVWQKAENARFYRFILSEDMEFKNIVADRTVEATTITLRNLNYNMSRYYWRVEAISDIGLAIEKETVKSNEQYFSFSTKLYEQVDTTDARKELESWLTLVEDVDEGEGEGDYFIGTKSKMQEEIEKMEAQLNVKRISQNKLNNTLFTFREQMSALSRLRNPKILLIDDLLKQGYWSFAPNSVYFNEEGGLWSGNTTGGLKLRRLENYEILKFNAKFNYKSSWQGFAIRSSSVEGVAWSGIDQYMVIIKPDILEFQKWNHSVTGGNVLIEYPNDYIRSGEMGLYEISALDQPDGSVMFTLKINNQVVIEYHDKENPLTKEGYFELYNMGSGDSINLIPVGRTNM